MGGSGEKLVRHAGWLSSVALALWLRGRTPRALAAALTALEACATDLVDTGPAFRCGNFGIIMLDEVWRKRGPARHSIAYDSSTRVEGPL